MGAEAEAKIDDIDAYMNLSQQSFGKGEPIMRLGTRERINGPDDTAEEGALDNELAFLPSCFSCVHTTRSARTGIPSAWASRRRSLGRVFWARAQVRGGESGSGWPASCTSLFSPSSTSSSLLQDELESSPPPEIAADGRRAGGRRGAEARV
ncbi:hypothetical protein T492DRAFT_949947 [Pavlovales sp. CCMP2436]|nr:hypothetical protein T492DRAFT_949947 [Pavlovales sp. CCMP2436]